MTLPPNHPGPASAQLPVELLQAMIDHARLEFPNEMCGVVIGDRPAALGGEPLRWAATRNLAASPLRYEIDPNDLYRLTIETDDADEAFWAIVHSHVRTAPRPSATDIELAYYPDALYLLISLEGDEPAAAAWRIVDGEVHQVELVVG